MFMIIKVFKVWFIDLESNRVNVHEASNWFK